MTQRAVVEKMYVNYVTHSLGRHMPASKRPDKKAEALHEHGALNPRPDAVEDERFEHSDFFDSRDLVQVRYEMLRRVRTEGRPVTETASRFGVSRPTYYKVSRDFDRGGLAALLPQKRGPKGGHKLTVEVLDELQSALDADPLLSLAALAEIVRSRFGLRVHPRSVERALDRRKKSPR